MLQEGDRGPVLHASATPGDHGANDVRVRLDWELGRQLRRRPSPPEGADLLPPLRLPRGDSSRGASGSGGDGHWSSETTIRTERSTAMLHDHFAEQLAQAGWSRAAAAADDRTAWSAWQLPGKVGWRAVLLALAVFEPSERFVMVRVERSGPDKDQEFTGYVRGGLE